MPETANKRSLKLSAIIYGTDFSLASHNAGYYAAHLAGYFSTSLLVVHAFTPTQAAMEVESNPNAESEQRRNLEFFLAKKARELADSAGDARPLLVEGDPKEEIPKLAGKNEPCLIVLGTHGGNWLEREVMGSTAEGILRSTSVPCLTVGPQVTAASEETLPFRKILYATDLTPESAHAAAYALSFAKAFGVQIQVLNVIPKDDLEQPDRFSQVCQKFYGALDHVAPEHIKTYCDLQSFVAMEEAHAAIFDRIRDNSMDLLVLGIQKQSHLGMQESRSGAFSLILKADCPVLTIGS